MTSISTSWEPDYLLRAIPRELRHLSVTPRELGLELFSQNHIWITALAQVKLIKAMENDHLLNTLLFLERVAADIYKHLVDPEFGHAGRLYYSDWDAKAAEWLFETLLYKALKNEVKERMV